MKAILRSLVVSGLLLIPAAAYSQGSGSTAPAKPKGKTPSRNFVVTRSFTGAVNSITEYRIEVKNRGGKIATFVLAPETKTSEGCLAAGKNVTVTYKAKDRRAISVRCR